MKTGLDQLPSLLIRLRGKRVGLLCHAASVDSRLRYILDLFPRRALRRLFGHEHGLWGLAQDMESVKGSVDPKTKLPVFSLYGSSQATLRPNKKMLEGLDAVVC